MGKNLYGENKNIYRGGRCKKENFTKKLGGLSLKRLLEKKRWKGSHKVKQQKYKEKRKLADLIKT